MKKPIQTLITLVLLLASTAGFYTHLAYAYPYSKGDQNLTSALTWLRSQQRADGSIGSFAISSWAVMAIMASEEDPNSWNNGGDSVVQYLMKNVGSLSSCSDYSRFILSMVAADMDPRNVGGVDLVARLLSFYDGAQFGDPGLLNDDYWAVMALISAGVYQDDSRIQNALTFIKAHQQTSGGWSYDANATWGPDVDDTAAAIMALISAGESPDSQAVVKGLAYIKGTQDGTGGFNGGWGYSAETDSCAIQAIVAAGQDPTSSQWTNSTTGKNPVDHLLTFQNSDGGFKDHTGSSSVWTTSCAIPALLGKPYPVARGVRVDMRLEGQSSTIWKGEVFVTWSRIVDNTGTTHYYKEPTVLGALDKASKKGGFTYVVTYQYGPAYVTEISGEKAQGANGWNFRVNDHTTGPYSADQYVLNHATPPLPPHTTILWYYGGWSDKVARISVDPTTLEPGESFTATVTWLDESSETWVPLQDAVVHVGSSYSYMTDSSGQATITMTVGGTYMVYAEKLGYVRTDKVEVSVSQQGRGGVNVEVNIIPAISIEVTPSHINFGTLGPGDVSQAFELQLVNSGSLNGSVTVTVIDEQSTVFHDTLEVAKGADGLWQSWRSYSDSIPGHGGLQYAYLRLNIPSNYPTPVLGVNTGKVIFWAEPE